MIHQYTGEGKGKTSGAIGLRIRAAGWGKTISLLSEVSKQMGRL